MEILVRNLRGSRVTVTVASEGAWWYEVGSSKWTGGTRYFGSHTPMEAFCSINFVLTRIWLLCLWLRDCYSNCYPNTTRKRRLVEAEMRNTHCLLFGAKSICGRPLQMRLLRFFKLDFCGSKKFRCPRFF